MKFDKKKYPKLTATAVKAFCKACQKTKLTTSRELSYSGIVFVWRPTGKCSFRQVICVDGQRVKRKIDGFDYNCSHGENPRIPKGDDLVPTAVLVDTATATARDSTEQTLDAFLNAYTDTGSMLIKRPKVRKVTAVNLAATVSNVRRVFPALLKRKLTSIAAAEIDACLSKYMRTNGTANDTINRYKGALSGVLQSAAESEGWALRENPCTKLSNLKRQGKPRSFHLNTAQQTAVKAQLRQRDVNRDRHLKHFADHLTPIVMMAWLTGMRAFEIFSLKWSDIDFDKGVIVLRDEVCKSGKGRAVVYDDELASILLRWRANTSIQLLRGGAFVFPSPQMAGKHVTTVRGILKPLLTNAGAFRINEEGKDEYHTLHYFRHAYVANMRDKGMPDSLIGQQVGHSAAEITAQYGQGADHTNAIASFMRRHVDTSQEDAA